MKRAILASVIVIYTLVVIVPSLLSNLLRIAQQCTVDDGFFAGSKVVQTCTCIGYEYFEGLETGADSKCIGYVSEVTKI